MKGIIKIIVLYNFKILFIFSLLIHKLNFNLVNYFNSFNPYDKKLHPYSPILFLINIINILILR